MGDLRRHQPESVSRRHERTENVRAPRDDGYVNTTERHERNGAIVLARKSGEKTGSIAARFGLTGRQTRRILAEHREDPKREIIRDPTEIFEATLATYDEEAARLAEISHTVRSDAVRLRAISERLKILDLKAKLVMSVGLMPPPEVVKFDRDAQKLANTVLEVFDEYGVPEAAQERIMEATRPPS